MKLNEMDATVPAWLADAVFYEIYPQSFFDANGDGIGDLEGIRRKLDYIQSLGCNVVWLNPCFDSPFGDAGYDVRDYRKIAPRYGTNADMRRLVRDLHKRGMRICLDFVPGHTSIEHPWFRQSCLPTPNKYTNWFIWTDSVWRGADGFKSVNGISDRDGQYVANFFWFQPALNYGFAKPDPKKPWQLPVDHPDVLAMRREMDDIMRFWLDMGVDGFRVDMASCLVKGDTDGAAMRAHWGAIHKWMHKEYPDTMLIAEWSNPLQAIPAGFHIDFMIHFGTPAYNSLFRDERSRNAFDEPVNGKSFFDAAGKGNIEVFLEHYLAAYKGTRRRGYISLPTGNHDISRLNTDRSVADLKVAMTFLLTMPGVPTIYYGDEIGMRYIRGMTSKEGGFGRTGSRTPMQWDSRRNAGFSVAADAKKLYLPIDPAADRPTVAQQETDGKSLLNHVRSLTQLRREFSALGNLGDFTPLHGRRGSSAFVYQRTQGRQKVVVALNPARKAAVAKLPRGIKSIGKKVFGMEIKTRTVAGKLTLTIPPRGYAVYLME